MKSKRDREEACFICGHYHDYEGGEPCGVCGHVWADQQHKSHQESVLATPIIPNFLYLGSYDTASRSELLKAMNITHMLNTVPTCQGLFKNTFTYHTVSTSPPDFSECFQFLDEAHKTGNKVLVYCMSGQSRSPTVVVGYLMTHRGWRLAESYKWVKDKRPSININPDDSQRLMDLEISLHGACSAPLGLAALKPPDVFLHITSSGREDEVNLKASEEKAATPNVFAASSTWSCSFPGVASPVFTPGPVALAAEHQTSQPFVFGGSSAPDVAPAHSQTEMEL